MASRSSIVLRLSQAPLPGKGSFLSIRGGIQERPPALLGESADSTNTLKSPVADCFPH